MLGLERRATEHELLDGETLDEHALRDNLREMAQLNRLPGGIGASIRGIRRLDPARSGTLLDVGTGGADLPRRLRRELPDATIVGVDARPEVIALARRWTHTDDRMRLELASAARLPFADGSVEVAHASLLLHHLDPPSAVAALAEMRRVSRCGVVVNDLRRGVLPFLVTATTVLALSRARYTRHDGVLSARRAYTIPEMDDLAAAAGLHPVWRSMAIVPRGATAYR
jgi:ubiquinone/menaquinone biosynthesis C-methylase UbiE